MLRLVKYDMLGFNDQSVEYNIGDIMLKLLKKQNRLDHTCTVLIATIQEGCGNNRESRKEIARMLSKNKVLRNLA